MGLSPDLPPGFTRTTITLQSAAVSRATALIDGKEVTRHLGQATAFLDRFCAAVEADAYQAKHGGLTPDDDEWVAQSKMHALFAFLTDTELAQHTLDLALLHNAVETTRRTLAMFGVGERRLIVDLDTGAVDDDGAGDGSPPNVH